MAEIPDSLRVLYEATLEEDDSEYTVSIPTSVIEASSLEAGDQYRVALLQPVDTPQSNERSSSASTSDGTATTSSQSTDGAPPVEEGEVRSVTIDTLGDQGDGIAKVERGFIVIVPGTQPGDRVDVEISDVKSSVAFAEPVSEPEVR